MNPNVALPLAMLGKIEEQKPGPVDSSPSHVFPPAPINSFFLVSTLTTGSLLRMNLLTSRDVAKLFGARMLSPLYCLQIPLQRVTHLSKASTHRRGKYRDPSSQGDRSRRLVRPRAHRIAHCRAVERFSLAPDSTAGATSSIRFLPPPGLRTLSHSLPRQENPSF